MDAANGYEISICGASGAVGVEIVECLHKCKFPVKSLRLFTSARSAGKKVETRYGELAYEEFSVAKARESDFCFLAVDGDFAREHAHAIGDNGGPVVIDNSSAYRYHDDVPLVVPEINAHAMRGSKLIANPNCTTAVAAMALWPLHQQYKLRTLVVSTYQAASGAGQKGMEELQDGLTSWANNQEVKNKAFVHPLPFNVLPHIDKFRADGYTKEEWKVLAETQKIFADPSIKVSCTAVRVPTLRAHAEALSCDFALAVTPDDARKTMAAGEGVEVVDDTENNRYPMPLNASTKFDVEVGRVRQSTVFGPTGLDMFVCGDQLLRGAALNAVLIAQHYVKLEQEGQASAAPAFLPADAKILKRTVVQLSAAAAALALLAARA